MEALSIESLTEEQKKNLEKAITNKGEILKFVGDLNTKARDEVVQAQYDLKIGNKQGAESCLKYSKIFRIIVGNLTEVYLNLVACDLTR